MSFSVRTNCPYDNKYYIRQVNGGWNGAIQGKPTKSGANVLANCVGYANGRFAEIQNLGYIKYQLVCNAENFIEAALRQGLKVVDHPVLGGIMVWQKGNTLSGSDGVGHVGIVEKIIDRNTIYTSESSYGGSAFYNATRSNSNGRWGMGSAYIFRGCIVNPAVGDEGFNGGEDEMTIYQNGSTLENVFADTGLTIKIGQLGKYEKCDCYGIFENRAVVRYRVNGGSNFKVGFVKWLGGVK